jgi:hypothetical protein
MIGNSAPPARGTRCWTPGHLAQWGDLIGGEIVFNAAAFSRARVQAMADDFLAICATCFADPSTRLSALRLPSAVGTAGLGNRISA